MRRQEAELRTEIYVEISKSSTNTPFCCDGPARPCTAHSILNGDDRQFERRLHTIHSFFMHERGRDVDAREEGDFKKR